MSEIQIFADSFLVAEHGLKVFRVEREGSGTVLWTSREALLRYLQNLQARRVQVDQYSR